MSLISLLSSRHKLLLATALKILSTLLFAWNDALSKYLTTASQHPLPASTVIFYQYTFAACALMVYYLCQSQRTAIHHLPYHALRIVLCTCGIWMINQSFTTMPLSYVVGFNLFSPLLTILWASLWLHEPMTKHKITALALSILAYLLLLDTRSLVHSMPDLPLSHCLMPTMALLCFQANTLVTKSLFLKGESVFHLTLCLFLGIPLLLAPLEYWHYHTLDTAQACTIILMAVNGLLATLALHQAIAIADLTFLLPFGFLKYSIVAFFGYLYFLEIPATNQLFGIAMTFSVLYYLHLTQNSNTNKLAGTR